MFAFAASSLNAGIAFHLERLTCIVKRSSPVSLSALVRGCVHPEGHSSRPRQVSLSAVSPCDHARSVGSRTTCTVRAETTPDGMIHAWMVCICLLGSIQMAVVEMSHRDSWVRAQSRYVP